MYVARHGQRRRSIVSNVGVSGGWRSCRLVKQVTYMIRVSGSIMDRHTVDGKTDDRKQGVDWQTRRNKVGYATGWWEL